VNSNRLVHGRMSRYSRLTILPSSTRTSPIAQALSGSRFAVSKSIAANVVPWCMRTRVRPAAARTTIARLFARECLATTRHAE
jgi:hypothetical protein